ncbi:IS110 family RNA-guided transposase, partial [Okibacterium endophyticum]
MLTTKTDQQQERETIIVAGVDTHHSTHHVAVLDLNGRVFGDHEFPVNTAGYRDLLGWVAGHGVIDQVGIELTDSYGAGLTRFLQAQNVTCVQVTTTDKAARARRGKTDQQDAIAAAQKVLAGLATAIPKDTTGSVESIRMLTLVRDSAIKNRTQAINQLKAVLVTAPATLREQLDGLTPAVLLKTIHALRPDTSRLAEPTHAAKHGLKRLAARISDLNTEISDADRELDTLVARTAPTLISHPGIGTHTAARFLITASNNIDRIRSDASYARLCGAAPIPVASGKSRRMRLHRGGDRRANSALHMIIISRLRHDQRTRDYRDKKLAQGHSTKDTIRALKRYI